MDDYPSLIYELIENGINRMKGENYEQAGALLLQAYSLFQRLSSNSQDPSTLLLIHHNLAVCCQKCFSTYRIRTERLEECVENISACIKQIPLLLKANKSISNEVKMARYVGRLHLQCCAMLSQLDKHEEALEHAKHGAKYMHIGIRHLREIIEMHASKSGVLEKAAKKLLPVVKTLQARLLREEGQVKSGFVKQEEFDVRSLFGFTGGPAAIAQTNIGSIVQMQLLETSQCLSDYDRRYELTRESVLERIALLVTSYFCVSTEKRFTSQNDKSKRRDSEFYHCHALKTACAFLPAECPLVSHMYATYQKHYSAVQQSIVALPVIVARRLCCDRQY